MYRRLIISFALLTIVLAVSALGRVNDVPHRAIKISSELSFLPSQEITYTSFSGATYTLNAYSGKYVRYALPDSWLGANGLPPQDVQQLVDSTDLLYAQMTELVGGEPRGDGLLTIAIVDVGTNAGLAQIGSKGVEISPALLDDTKSHVAKGLVPETIIHEMAHDFDIYHDYLSYYNDWGHAWTTLLISYMEIYSRSGSLTLGPDELLNQAIQDDTGLWYVLGNQATWAACVRNGGGCEANGVKANEAWAGLVMQYARLHGPDALKRAMLYLRDYKAAHAEFPSTPEAKNDLLITALATGGAVQISCEMDAWHWSLTDAERASLAQAFPANPFCADADGDGYTLMQGDLDDHNPGVHPGAVEVINGIDDDCNGVADDVLVKESNDFGNDAQGAQMVSVPSRIQGHAAVNDLDVFRIEAASPLQLNIEGRSVDSFNGTIMVGNADGLENATGFTVSAGADARSTFTLERAGTWLITLSPDAGAAGDYEVKITRSRSLLNPVQITVSPGTTPGALRIQAAVDATQQFYATPTHIRFWIGEEGFVKTLPLTPGVSFEWIPATGGTITMRAQLLAGEIPVSRTTEPVWYDTSAGSPVNPSVADLVLISRTSVPPVIRNNQTLVYGLEVKNLGPDAADNVQATVTLGQGLRITNTATSRGSVSQSGANTITFTIGALARGESIGISISVDPAQATGTLTTSAAVSASSSDSNQSNNSVSWSTTITIPPLESPFFGLPLKPVNSPNLHILPESGLARARAVLPDANLGTLYAQADESGNWPGSLGGVTVNIGGRAAQVVAVTQAPGFTSNNPVYQVDFAVPQNGPVGKGIMVTVTHWPSGAAWSALAEIQTMPSLWSSGENSNNMAIAQDADTFVAVTPEHPAPASSQTRIVLYATGLKSLIIFNSLTIRARTSDNHAFILPVDYASEGKIMPGLDQVIVRLTPELAGADQVMVSIDGYPESQVTLPVQ
jgi:uncharacterized repeat protein (TIGR01451 family)